MKRIEICILSFIIVAFIGVFCFCSKEPVKTKVDFLKKNNNINTSSLKKERWVQELLIKNKSTNSITVNVNRYNSDVWYENYNFTDSMWNFNNTIDSAEAWGFNHVHVDHWQEGKDNLGYSKYRITITGEDEYFIIDYRDDMYYGQSENYATWDLELWWNNDDTWDLIKPSAKCTTDVTNSSTSIWAQLSKGERSISEFEKIRVTLTGTNPLTPGTNGSYNANPRFLYSFEDSWWWKRTGTTREELTNFRGETSVSYGSEMTEDFWLIVKVEDTENNSDEDSLFVEIDYQEITDVCVDGPMELSPDEAGNFEALINPENRSCIKTYYKWYRQILGTKPAFLLINEGATQDTIYTSCQSDFNIAVIVIDSVYSCNEFSDTILVEVNEK